MLSIFKKKEVFGEMDIIFPDKLSAFISDSIPKEIPGSLPESVCDLWFAMMFAGKLLYNFPGNSGVVAAQDALEKLSKKCASESTQYNGEELFPNVSLLGLFLSTEVTILSDKPNSGKLYRGIFFKQNDNYLVETKIDFGDEDYYHRATIDVMLETERIKLGDKGNAMVTAVAGYLPLIIQNGTSNLNYNLSTAASCAMTSASKYPDIMAKIEALRQFV